MGGDNPLPLFLRVLYLINETIFTTQRKVGYEYHISIYRIQSGISVIYYNIEMGYIVYTIYIILCTFKGGP